LPRLLEMVRTLDPALTIEWDNRLGITVRTSEVSRAWSWWKTKNPEALVCGFVGKKGQFNLSQLEPFGIQPQLRPHRDGEILLLSFQHENHLHIAPLKELLRQHLAGFREAFAKAALVS